jgi:membrane protease YdiL (CAAX protease family)
METDRKKIILVALLSIVVIFLLYQILGSLLTLLIFGDKITQNINNFRLFTISSQILFILAPTLIFSKKYLKNLNSEIGFKLIPFKELLIYFIGYFVLFVNLNNIIYFQNILINQIIKAVPAINNIKTLLDKNATLIEETYKAILSINSPTDLLVVFLMVTFTPALCEELFFRGFLQHYLLKAFNFAFSALVTAFFFSLLHFDVYGFFPLMLLSLYFSYVVYKSNSIFSSMILHFTNNLLALIGSIILKTEDIFNKSTIDKDLSFNQALISFIILSIVFILIILYIEKNHKINNSEEKFSIDDEKYS